MSNSNAIGIGIDVGSTSANVAVVDANGKVLEEYYVRTKGRPVETVIEILRNTLPAAIRNFEHSLVFTGSAGRLIANLTGAQFINEVVAQTCAIRHFHPAVRSVIEIGGETTKLMTLSADSGEIEDFAMNSLCAAGTGSFLDQQATRLNLTIEEFGRLALESESPPRIAGRCSVFAKSDMIHLQQIATPDYDIVAGLCYAVARNFKSTIARGKDIERPVAFQGGVAANPGVRKGLAEVMGLQPEELIVPEYCASMGAVGAVLVSRKENGACSVVNPAETLEAYVGKTFVADRAALAPLGSAAAAGDAGSHPTVDAAAKKGNLYLGIDVGSISTNLVVIDEEYNVVARRYLMTAGRPIEAVRKGLGEIGEELGADTPIAGVGTTGSGRYLAFGFVGGDVVRNEITAQATAALHIDPNVDTIFEIGGQDSKYISLRSGAVVDFEMNKVCAAGTGSFLEEQAERLDIEIKGTFGKLALGADSPVPMGERCTVFIESDLTRHQQMGAKVDDIVAGLSYSIVHNYLNKVVGQRRVGERIFFQGGTAFNQGVVAAFEKVIGRPITVPPHHDVTGAIGAAILAKRENVKGHSNFKGFDLSRKKYTIKTFGCRECSNMCEIRKVTVEGEEPIFYGSRCEKYEVDKEKKQTDSIPDLFAEREQLLMNIAGEPRDLPSDAPVIGIPRCLFLYEHYPFWKTFFSELGFRVELSGETSKQIIHQGVETVVAEFCFPVKVADGHVLDLIKKGVRRIFLPSIVDMPRSEGTRNSFNCPYVQTFPYTVRSAIDFERLGVEVLSPPIYFGRGEKMLRKSMLRLGSSLNVSAAAVKKALTKARSVQNEFFSRLVRRGREILNGLGSQDRALVVVSRPYNGCDSRINLNLPQKLRQLGVLPIPIDMMPWEELPEEKRETRLYWKAGQRIMQTARLVKDDQRLFAVYLTNFGCGPDSFISHFFSKEMKGKPYLQLEIDEHSADAGVVTRCEAFMDSLKNYRPEDKSAGGNGEVKEWNKAHRKRTVYVPYMADQAHAIIAAFQACGVNAEMMDESDAETLDIGRKYTSGRECYPCILTTGDMIKTFRKPGFDPDRSAFFMASGSGPCRFGQYHRLHRLILDELGYEKVPIFSPNQDYEFYRDLGMVDNGFSNLAWEGIVAVDLLEKKLRETKPYEITPGETEAVYAKWVAEVSDAIRRRASVAEVLRRARREMDAIPVSKDILKPIVGVVGEIYVRSNRFSNEHIISKIEELGGEVWMPPMSEWFFYINHCSKRHSREQGERSEFFKVALKNWFQHRKEKEYYASFHGSVRNLHEPTTVETLDRAKPYIHPTYEGEAVLSVGKSTDYIHKGAAGIINAIPFTCMPGNIVSAVFKPFRQANGGIPILNLSYDGQGKTNSQTRLEAFMYQVSQYHKAKRFS